MEVIQQVLTDSGVLPHNFIRLYNNIPFAIFDIETTGLSPYNNQVILIGILYYKNSQLIVEQLFCHSREEEIKLLESFIEKVKEIPLLITYNGDAFDIPFLNKRIDLNKAKYEMPIFCSFDLLKVVRNFRHHFQLSDCKLKSIEKSLGIHREDIICGRESVELYNQFERTGEKHLKDTILLHNHDDLRYLLQSMAILDKISYEELISHVPQILNGSYRQLCTIKKAVIKNSSLSITGSLVDNCTEDFIIHKPGFSFHYNANTQSFLAQVPLYKGTLESKEKCLYIDTSHFPFSYSPNTKNHDSIPDNIVLFKKDKIENKVEINSFARRIISYIIEEILSVCSS